MENKNSVTTNLELATLFVFLPAHPDLAVEYESEDGQEDRWWKSQREHMISWFFSRTCRGGIPGYEVKTPWLDAKTTYNKLGNPAALIWLAAALEIDSQIIRRAMSESLSSKNSGESPRTRCRIIRKIIPWETIDGRARELIHLHKIDIHPGICRD